MSTITTETEEQVVSVWIIFRHSSACVSVKTREGMDEDDIIDVAFSVLATDLHVTTDFIESCSIDSYLDD